MLFEKRKPPQSVFSKTRSKKLSLVVWKLVGSGCESYPVRFSNLTFWIFMNRNLEIRHLDLLTGFTAVVRKTTLTKILSGRSECRDQKRNCSGYAWRCCVSNTNAKLGRELLPRKLYNFGLYQILRSSLPEYLSKQQNLDIP